MCPYAVLAANLRRCKQSKPFDDRFEAAFGRVAEPDCVSMQAMADLFALQRIQQDILFRNDDYVAPEKAKAIKRMIEKLCSELRGVCCPLVDAFAIPDFILRAPIGLSTAAKDPYAAYLQSIGWD